MFGGEGGEGWAHCFLEGGEGLGYGGVFGVSFGGGGIECFVVGGGGGTVDPVMLGLVEAGGEADRAWVWHHAVERRGWGFVAARGRWAGVLGLGLGFGASGCYACSPLSREVLGCEVGHSCQEEEKVVHCAVDCVLSSYRCSRRTLAPTIIR